METETGNIERNLPGQDLPQNLWCQKCLSLKASFSHQGKVWSCPSRSASKIDVFRNGLSGLLDEGNLHQSFTSEGFLPPRRAKRKRREQSMYPRASRTCRLVRGNISGLSDISTLWALNASNVAIHKRPGFENKAFLTGFIDHNEQSANGS